MASQAEAENNPKFKPIDLSTLEKDERSLAQRADDQKYEDKVHELNVFMHMQNANDAKFQLLHQH